MSDTMVTARALNQLYMEDNGTPMRELRMQKLLYFIQKESLRTCGQPVFPEAFQGWRYGPVLLSIRAAYKNPDPFADQAADEPTASAEGSDPKAVLPEESDLKTASGEKSIRLTPSDQELSVIRTVYDRYKTTSDWKLNYLTQEEFSWLLSRDGLDPEDNGTREISLDAIEMDILKDEINRRFEDCVL